MTTTTTTAGMRTDGRAASARHDRIVREQVEASGGHVFKTAGNAHRAVLADPVAALSSAVAIQRAAGGVHAAGRQAALRERPARLRKGTEADGPLVVFITLLAGVVRDHPDLCSAGVFGLAWRCGRCSSSERRRRISQKQATAKMTVRPTKIAVSYHWKAQ
jgi:hypothetical protein